MRLFILIAAVFALFAGCASPHSANTMTVTTYKGQNYSGRQLAYCQESIRLTRGHAAYDVGPYHSGMVLDACAPLLHAPNCRTDFDTHGGRKLVDSARFMRVTRRCAAEYCPRFRDTSTPQLCSSNTDIANADHWGEFYTSALRLEFLAANNIEGLKVASSIGHAMANSIHFDNASTSAS